jgi:hypothetical protein
MKFLNKGLAQRLAIGLGLAGLVSVPLSANAGVAGTPPAVGTPFVVVGGSSAIFPNAVIATLASMTTVFNVFQECATGANVSSINGGAGTAGKGCNLPAAVLQGGHSAIQNFIAIHGMTRACGANTPPLCYGTPAATELVVFISGNGSGYGVQCTSPAKGKLGVVGIAGLDGIYGDTDDPIHTLPAFPVGDLIPAGWPGAGATAAAISSCPGQTTAAVQLANTPAATAPPNVGNEYCIIDFDINGDGVVGKAGNPTGAQVGGVTPSGVLGATTIGTAVSADSPNNETSNLAEQCVAGVADVPPLDFTDAAINVLTMDNSAQIGEQVFKIIVNTSLRPQSNGLFPTITSANKIWLSKAQLQAIFGSNSNAFDVCTWHDVGVTDLNAGNPNQEITVCQRESVSGTLATYVNHFHIDKYGTHVIQPSAGITNLSCTSTGENFAAEPTVTKHYREGFGTSDETNCVQATGAGTGTVGQIGYVSGSSTGGSFYAPVVEGVDADAYSAKQIRNLVKCGLWPFVGPSVAGTGIADATGVASYMISALTTVGLFDEGNSPNFVSLGDGLSNGIANQKARVDGPYSAIFTAENALGAPGLPLTPQTFECESVGLPPVAP